MEFGIEKYSFMLILCAYQAFKVIKNGVNIQNILISIGYITVTVIYFKYEDKIKKAIYEILPFLIFYWLIGTLFKVIIEVSFRQN
mgnify:CR=1 FL=1